MRTTFIALTVLSAWPVVGRADDSKKESLTLLPWTDASIVFTANDKRARVVYNQVSDTGISTTLEGSAPLDEDTRIAAFTAENHLVSGWKGSFQVGWDQRADRLGVLRQRVEKFAEALKVLKSVATTPVKAKARFSVAHELDGSDTAVLLFTCARLNVAEGACAPSQPGPAGAAGDTGASGDTPASTEKEPALEPLMDAVCKEDMEGACTAADFIAAAPVYLAGRCPKEVDTSVPCFTVAWMASRSELSLASETAIEQYRLVAVMWALLQQADPEQAKKLKEKYARPFDAVVADPDVFVNVIAGITRKAALERRDILLTGQLVDTAWTTSLVLDGSLSYDRSKVYQDDIATKAKDAAVSDFEFGVNASLTPGVRGLTLNGRVGIERKRESGAKPFERCSVPMSSDAGVTGKMCDSKALFRSGARPDAETGAYIRLAVDYLRHPLI